MYTSVELLDMVKARYGIASDYAAAKKLSLTRSFISKIRQGKSYFGLDTSLQIAELLELDPLKVIGSTRFEQAERAHDAQLKDLWQPYAA